MSVAARSVWLGRVLYGVLVEAVLSRRMPATLRFLAIACLALAPLLASAAPTTVTIKRADCAALVEHRPAPDVAYLPGVDGRGRAVVPADLEPHQLALPEIFTIDITVDLFERLCIPPQGAANFVGEARVGVVELDAENRFTVNGKPITSDAQRQLTERCQQVR